MFSEIVGDKFHSYNSMIFLQNAEFNLSSILVHNKFTFGFRMPISIVLVQKIVQKGQKCLHFRA